MRVISSSKPNCFTVPSDERHKAYYPDAVSASDLRSIRVRDPARRVFRVVMEVRDLLYEAERKARRAKDGMESDDATKS